MKMSDTDSFRLIKEQVAGDPFWEPYLRALSDRKPSKYSVHLAIFVEPFLSLLLKGQKTVESRFSSVRCAPYRRVQRGDVLLLKKSGGPVVGLCLVGSTWFYRLDPESWKMIRQEYSKAICAEDPNFWEARSEAEYATLMMVENVRKISSLNWEKRDRRGWVVLKVGDQSKLFEDLMNTNVILFAGKIRSGKTTVSTQVAKKLGCAFVSFGDYVRNIAKLRGLEDTRENLQSVGGTLIDAGVRQFCLSVLAQSNWNAGQAIIIDGVRHLAVFEELKRLVSPSKAYLVFVSTEVSIREDRNRSHTPESRPLSELDRHPVETESILLQLNSDLVIDGARAADDLATEIAEWIQQVS